MTLHSAYRVAAVQAAPIYLNLDATIDKSIKLIKDAADGGAKLVAFPENFFPGYPFFLFLGTPAWSMQFCQRYHENSLIIGSDQYQRLANAARENHIFLSFGFSEKSGGSLYMAQALIDDKGVTINTRRKLKPTYLERTLFGEGDGSDLSVFQTPIGRIGSLCCWEHLQPLSKYAMYSQNEQIHIAAWPSFSMYSDVAFALTAGVNNAVTQTYAVEGQSFVLAPSSVVDEVILDMLCQTDESRKLLASGGGHTRIYGPDGRSLVTPISEFEEGILYADIDLADITFAKVTADPVGHYSRPDVTRLLLNKSARRPVHFEEMDGVSLPPTSKEDEITISDS